MQTINGIAYANIQTKVLEIDRIKPLDDMMMIVEFNNNEKRIYDAMPLLEMPAFKRLEDNKIFRNAKIVNGIITWCDEEIDISTEAVYNCSYKYDQIGN